MSTHEIPLPRGPADTVSPSPAATATAAPGRPPWSARLAASLFASWGRLLLGRRPMLSIEITSRCPLRCPGCYAYAPDHLGGEVTLAGLADRSGDALVDGVLGLVRRRRPVMVSIIGGEPLVRHRELDRILPRLAELGIHTQLVTSAVLPIPRAWATIPRLALSVSVDGLPAEHDARRKPATYDRILDNIAGHEVTIHWTLTRPQLGRDGYVEEFLAHWDPLPTTRRIWVSLYTPQRGEVSAENLTPGDRRRAVELLLAARPRFPKLDLPAPLIRALATPPASPAACTFARVTECVSADLTTRITPCQLGGEPDCASCGCLAAAGFQLVAAHRLPGGLRIGTILDASLAVGDRVRRYGRRASAAPSRS